MRKHEWLIFLLARLVFYAYFIGIVTEKQILELRDDLDEQYKKDRETLDRMLELVRRREPNGAGSGTDDDPTRGMLIKDKIAYYVLSIPNNFTMQEARKFIQEKDPRFASKLRPDALSAALYQMNKAGRIKIVIPKKGISGAIYSKNEDFRRETENEKEK